jgi:hypothetical protein
MVALATGASAFVGEGATPALAEGPAATTATPQSVFRGKVESFKGRRIELRYDFADAVQGEDWAEVHPFVLPPRQGGWRIEGGALRGSGSVSYRLRAVFDGDVSLEATMDSEKGKDFGAAVISEEGSTFTLFSVNDAFFSIRDNSLPNQHMVTTFLPSGTGPGGTTYWRYVQRTYEPRVAPGKVRISLRKKGAANEFKFGEGGTLAGNDVEATVGPEYSPAFCILESNAVVTGVKVTGVLSAAWLRSKNIPFEELEPKEPETPAATGPGAAAGADSDAWKALVRIVTDATKPKEDREKAAKDLVAGKEKRAVRPMIDLMYSDEDEVGREVGLFVLRGISGKDPGYRPSADKDTRLKSMDKVWAIWYGLRNLIEKEDAKKTR